MSDKDLIKHLTDANFSHEVAVGVTLVDFYATWCGPCKMLAPLLEQVALELKGKVKIGKINIEEEQKTPDDFGVTAFPTMILFKDGKEVGRLLGLRKADVIKNFIEGAFR